MDAKQHEIAELTRQLDAFKVWELEQARINLEREERHNSRIEEEKGRWKQLEEAVRQKDEEIGELQGRMDHFKSWELEKAEERLRKEEEGRERKKLAGGEREREAETEGLSKAFKADVLRLVEELQGKLGREGGRSPPQELVHADLSELHAILSTAETLDDLQGGFLRLARVVRDLCGLFLVDEGEADAGLAYYNMYKATEKTEEGEGDNSLTTGGLIELAEKKVDALLHRLEEFYPFPKENMESGSMALQSKEEEEEEDTMEKRKALHAQEETEQEEGWYFGANNNTNDNNGWTLQEEDPDGEFLV